MSAADRSCDLPVRGIVGGTFLFHLSVHPDKSGVDEAATACLASWLADPATHTIMPAAGNSPLEMYRRIAAQGIDLSRLSVFTLDEYVGVPRDGKRNCTQVLRRCVQEAWGIPNDQFHGLSPLAEEAPAGIREHERKIASAGGLDVVVLGLGQNGHLGFNEPGSHEHGAGRLVDLDNVSIEANRDWFDGDHAPAQGVTTGLGVVLAARRILLLATGAPQVGGGGCDDPRTAARRLPGLISSRPLRGARFPRHRRSGIPRLPAMSPPSANAHRRSAGLSITVARK